MNNKYNYTSGLNEQQVIESRTKYGTNKIEKVKKETFLQLFIESLGDPIIRILIIALGIKLVFLISDFDWYETIGIVIAIFLASFISTISEYGSEKAFEKLQEDASKIKCRVRRNNNIELVNIEDIVVNDIVLLQAGDRIPADGIIIDGEISVDESSLNGETKEKYKRAPIRNNNPTENNFVYKGTVVYSKEATMLVTKVGIDTMYGRLALEVQEKQPESPLKLRLRHLAKIISRIGYFGAGLVFISYLFSVIVLANNFDIIMIKEMLTNWPLLLGHILYALTLCVTIIVVAVPEGLPMMITLVLSSNMKRMLKNNVLVRKMTGIETAGSINVLFTDKTGTITKGQLEVISVIDGELTEFKNEQQLSQYPNIYNLFKMSMVVNNASTYNDKREIVGGNTTDRALLRFFNDNNTRIRKILTIPFDSNNKYSVVETDNNQILIKGAPEKILPACIGYYDKNGNKRILLNKKEINKKIEAFTSCGIRVLALAKKEKDDTGTYLKNLLLVGIVAIKDEIREHAISGLKLINDAHIQTVMITGDNPTTAMAIAKEINLINNVNDLVLTSDELNKMDDWEIKEKFPYLKVVARALPQDKSRLVKIAQDLNLVVGMTGDGVNDAPALKKADVGFAMGSGAEVAKEASDIVILDNNILSIANAILFGRTIFKSIRKFIIFQLTINMCAMSLSILGPLLGIETPVTVIQMLWINMVMDTLAGLAFAFEPPLKEYMLELPKKKDESIINKYMLNEILITGAYSSFLCILFLKTNIIRNMFVTNDNDLHLMSAFFGLFIFMSIFNCFNARTHRINIFANLLKNKIFLVTIIMITVIQILMIYYGGNLFRTVGLTYQEFFIMLTLAISVIPFDWCRKIVLRLLNNKDGV